MRKIILFTFALCSVCLFATPRSIQQARRAFSSSSELRHVYTAVQPDGKPAFYVFNKGDEQGFVIISADDRAYTILGYSDTGRWEENDLPENMRAWLGMYQTDLEQLARLPEAQMISEDFVSYTPVAPLCATKWNQSAPYNESCPSYQGKSAAAGCVAVAASQIMKKHAYPEHGVGEHSYKWVNENGDSITLSADFANTTYDWSNMLNTYTTTSASDKKKAVATLIYQTGVACNMKYGKSSSATSSTMIGELINTFKYDKGIRVLYKNYAGDSILLDAIQEDLLAGRPVYLSAKTVEGTGHAFVCDGMDADGLLHINWGWGGKSDGYFRLSALAPSEQGTGGSATNKAYTESVQIYTRIQPDAGGDYVHHLICERVQIERSDLARQDTVKFVVDTVRNRGFAVWNGNLRLRVYQNGELYESRTITKNKLLKPWNFYYHLNYKAAISYPPGEYELVMSIRDSAQSKTYIPLYCHGEGEWRCHMTITNDSIHLSRTSPVIPQALEATKEEVQPMVQKILRNGVLYIRREGETYTLQGLRVND